MEKIKTTPMDKAWKKLLEKKWWSTNYRGNKSNFKDSQIELIKLRDRLLEFGGEEACLPTYEEDYNKIMTRGRLFIVKNNDDIEDECDVIVKHWTGEDSQCHRNSVNIWNCYKDKLSDLHISTGYALSDDGMWRQHSWLVITDKDNILGYNTVIETTVPRLAYYGFIMNEEEMEEFSQWY